MSEQDNAGTKPEIDLDELVASSDIGGRNLTGGVGRLLTVVAICWSLYQL